MNKHQKIGVRFAAAALLLLAILHGPWTGYDTEYPAQPIDAAVLLQHCQTEGNLPDPNLGAAEVSRRFADELACVERLRPQTHALPFLAWRSQSPMLPRFGNVVLVCAVAAAIVALASFWHFLFCASPRTST